MSAIEIYYLSAFLASVLLTVIYFFQWHRHMDIHITLIFVLVPIFNLQYWLLARAENLQQALDTFKMSFIGGFYLELIILLVVFSLCEVPLNRWIKMGLMIFGTVICFSALTIGKDTLFYQSISFEKVNGVVRLPREYGTMHTMYRVMMIVYFALSLGCIIYTLCRKNQVSRKILILLFLPEAVAIPSFLLGRTLLPDVELMPAAYVVAQITYLIIVSQVHLYDVMDTAVDTLTQTGETGFITFDYKYRYLGSNPAAKRIFPELMNLTVDLSVKRSRMLQEIMQPWMEAFRNNPDNNRQLYARDGRDYEVTLNWLYNGRRKKGYQLTIRDDTKDQEHIRMIKQYNERLKSDVDKATAHIVEMHDQLILGMATMVESRDNSTGGHIRRTSEGVHILTHMMQKDPESRLDEKFRKNLIKAAPMHDLGKIAVDDAVLRKPGRFTPEEYEIMKKHAPEGQRIVHEILKGTDDEEFRQLAENVAHYHHERWDGKGYPEGLKGEEIPLEARVMAIADVYDALVSKRVYKDSMSFEKADAIMMEGMGSQFDPGLEKYYVAARPRLEAYYSGLGGN